MTELREQLPCLVALKQGLRTLDEMRDGVQSITPFFNLISPFHDEQPLALVIERLKQKNRRGQYHWMIDPLEQLSAHFVIAGRDRFGWNRTQTGEEVTEDNVFLGDIDGYWTKTVSYIKTQKDDAEYYVTMSRQAKEFIQSHTTPMIQIIQLIERICASFSQDAHSDAFACKSPTRSRFLHKSI